MFQASYLTRWTIRSNDHFPFQVPAQSTSPLSILAATCSQVGSTDTANKDEPTCRMETSEIVDQGTQPRQSDPSENVDFGLVTPAVDEQVETLDSGICGGSTATTTVGDSTATAPAYVVPQYKSVTVDGQEAIFIPITAASSRLDDLGCFTLTHQLFFISGLPLNSRMVFSSGQAADQISTSGTAAQTSISFTTDQSQSTPATVSVLGNDTSQPLTIQTNPQQSVSVQIPVISPNGKATMQTVQIPWQHLVNLVGPALVNLDTTTSTVRQDQQYVDQSGTPVTVVNLTGDGNMTTTSVAPPTQQVSAGPKIIRIQTTPATPAAATQAKPKPAGGTPPSSLPILLPKAGGAVQQTTATSASPSTAPKFVVQTANQVHQPAQQQQIIINGQPVQIQTQRQPQIVFASTPTGQTQQIILPTNATTGGGACQLVCGSPAQQVFTLQTGTGQNFNTGGGGGGQQVVILQAPAATPGPSIVQLQPGNQQIIYTTTGGSQNAPFVVSGGDNISGNPVTILSSTPTSGGDGTAMGSDAAAGASSSTSTPTTAYVISNPQTLNLGGALPNAGNVTLVPLNWPSSQTVGASQQQQAAQFIQIGRQPATPAKSTTGSAKSTIIVGK